MGQARLLSFRAGNREEALAWIALEAFLYRLASHMGWMALETIGPTGALRPSVWTIDEALFERIRIAEWVDHVAAPLRWDKAVAAAP